MERLQDYCSLLVGSEFLAADNCRKVGCRNVAAWSLFFLEHGISKAGYYGKRFQRLEVFPVGEKGGVWGGAVQMTESAGTAQGVDVALP